MLNDLLSCVCLLSITLCELNPLSKGSFAHNHEASLRFALASGSPRQTESTSTDVPAYSPITRGSCNNPPFYQGTTRLRRWVQRVIPPFLYSPGRQEPAYLYSSFSSVNSRCPQWDSFAHNPLVEGRKIQDQYGQPAMPQRKRTLEAAVGRTERTPGD
ncbi:hypothetical protein AVEN_15424-1 [Araneus ventricosus]|uniref:Secreted protein n=1 Tax=Araneus ventricosus TaxID=182803 RepID=A0A4Y2CU16_ARAVE|nr:hypothetical protein AVEN_15424-1 [Araneus ventricosus]